MNDKTFEPITLGDRYWSHPSPEATLALIRRFGIFGLGGSDGCYCCNFSIHGISIDVSCHKSEHCVRIHTGCLGFSDSALFMIADEVLSQLPDGGERYRVRFCDYSCDHVNGHWDKGKWVESYKCVYCSKPRADRDAYLCGTCVGGDNHDGHLYQRKSPPHEEPR